MTSEATSRESDPFELIRKRRNSLGTRGIHQGLAKTGVKLMAGRGLRPNCRSGLCRQFPLIRGNCPLDRAKTDGDILLGGQLLANNIAEESEPDSPGIGAVASAPSAAALQSPIVRSVRAEPAIRSASCTQTSLTLLTIFRGQVRDQKVAESRDQDFNVEDRPAGHARV